MTEKRTVICAQAALGYERLQGTGGTLEACPLPFLGYLFYPDSEKGQVTIEDLCGWSFRDLDAVEDPIFAAARETREPVRVAIIHWCTAAPAGYRSYVGKEFKAYSDANHWVCCDDQILVAVSDAGWNFTEEPPFRRSREVYEHESFVRDLDEAIGELRQTVLSQWSREPLAQPMLPPGCTREKATLSVCQALAQRRLTIEQMTTMIDPVLDAARVMLIQKNQAYGNSALDPVRVFSQASLKEQLLVRLDDKASRLARGHAGGEDVAQDMLGYLLLLAIAEKRERAGEGEGQ